MVGWQDTLAALLNEGLSTNEELNGAFVLDKRVSRVLIRPSDELRSSP